MESVVQLKADLVRLMQDEPPTQWPDEIANMKRELDDTLARAGASLEPIHPGVRDADLSTYFSLAGVSQSAQEDVLGALRSLEAVTAAYSKPRAEPA